MSMNDEWPRDPDPQSERGDLGDRGDFVIGDFERGLEQFRNMARERDEFQKEVDRLRYAEKCLTVERDALTVSLNVAHAEAERKDMEIENLIRENAVLMSWLAAIQALLAKLDLTNPKAPRVKRSLPNAPDRTEGA